MSRTSVSPYSAPYTYPSSASATDRTPTKSMVDPKALECRLRGIRPLVKDWTEKLRACAQHYYDQLIAQGGRPTRLIKYYPDCKTTRATDGSIHYRDEYEKIEVIFEVDKHRSSSHWAEEKDVWDRELCLWERFKEAQRVHNQYGRSDLDLELENTDAALVEVLSKLNDWQEFVSMHHRKVQEAKWHLEDCERGNARSHSAMVAATNADAMLEIREQPGRWLWPMRKAQEKLEASQNKLMCVKRQWTEVIAESCLSIAAAPKLQEQLEAKFERQTRAVYRTLQEMGARPSRAVYTPDKDAELPRRLQHWISESSLFTAELEDWRVFMAWRRQVREADNMKEEGRKVLSEGDSLSELLEDFVKYQQHELDEAASWVVGWHREARRFMKANRWPWPYERSSTSCEDIGRNFFGREGPDEEDVDDSDVISDDSDDDIPEARRVASYIKQAEEKVSVAAKRLEQSKQKLEGILVELGPHSARESPAAHSGVQILPTPPNSPSPEDISKSRRLMKKGFAGKSHRRSKKEKARKEGAKIANANIEQHALPIFPLVSKPQGENEDIEMSDDAEDPSSIEIKKELNEPDSEDAFMDVRSKQIISSPSDSHPKPALQSRHRKSLSQCSSSLQSKKTQSTTKLDHIASGKILKKSSKNKPCKNAKSFTEQQTTALLHAVSTAPTSIATTEPQTYPTPPTRTTNNTSPSPSSSAPPSRKAQPTSPHDRTTSGRIQKTTNKTKPPKKTKPSTENQTTALLLTTTSTRSPPPGPNPPRRRSERLRAQAAAGKGRT